MSLKVALGMYTVRQSVEKDMPAAFAALRRMGYTGIEFYGEPEFDIDLVNHSIQTSGLELTSWHVEWRNLQPDTFQATAEYLEKVRCPIAVVPCLGGKWNVNHTPDQECRAIWEGYIAGLNGINQQLRPLGLRMGYHNHEHEFLLKYDGKTVFDILFEGLHPDIIMELDTGNCIEGGYDPAAIIKKHGGRDILLHLKPYSRRLGFQTALGDENDENDWRAILAAVPKEPRLIVESENSLLPEMENARQCLEALRAFL
ncbi:MAG: sugar phosphate isomerase/epimerase [Clostridiales bacterium]|jgi:sugar phosphate isomerase/epimerase|nr:sugar phosphate isomerase/epimerase [Clostridiales bacterium]